MAIEFKDGKYVDPQTGRVTLDPTMYKDWQIAEEAEKNLPSVDYFREKLGLLPEEIIPYGKTPKIDFIKVMNRLKDKPDGKFIEVTAITPTPFGEGKSTVSLGLIEGLGKLGLNVGGALRQPSGGPTMNVKGTAAGGGHDLRAASLRAARAGRPRSDGALHGGLPGILRVAPGASAPQVASR